MTTFDLTAGETKIAMILVANCLKNMGGDRPNDLDEDKFTWACPQDIMNAGYSRHEAAGFWGSLEAKGVVEDHGDDESFVTDDAYHFVDTIWDANQHLLAA